MPDFRMPDFEGADGQRWIWDPSSKSYVVAEGDGMVPDRSNRSGGDNNLFDPATQYQGNPFGDGGGNFNPLQEGILAAKQAAPSPWYPPNRGPEPDHWDTYEDTDEASICPHCGEDMGYSTSGTCRNCRRHVASATPGHAEDCGCPECEHYRQELRDTPTQVHDTGPFPDQPAKPNRFKTDNSYPSMISKVRNEMYDHLPTWDDKIRREGADLSSCPECGDSMFDSGAEKACHSCGSRQPVIYTTAGLSVAEGLAGPLMEGAGMGAEGGMGIGGIGKMMNQAMGSVDDVAGAGGTGPGGGNGKGKGTAPGAPEQGTVSHLREAIATVRWGLQMYAGSWAADMLPQVQEYPCPHCNSPVMADEKNCPTCGSLLNGQEYWSDQERHVAGMDMGMPMPSTMQPMQNTPGPGGSCPTCGGPMQNGSCANCSGYGNQMDPLGMNYTGGNTFGEPGTGGANKNDGLDHNPAEKETQGFNEEHGSGPELLKDVDDVGGTYDPAKATKIFEILAPHIVQPHIEAGGTGAEDPLLQALDSVLEAAFPGYRDNAKSMLVEVTDPNAPKDVTGDEDEKDGSDDGVEHHPAEQKAAMIKEAPGNQHMKGVSPKRNRQYEHIKEQLMESGKGEDEAKEEAARTVNKQRAEHGETKEGGVAGQMGMGYPMGNPMNTGGPCPICGMDDCPHKRGQQGNATPNPAFTQQDPNGQRAELNLTGMPQVAAGRKVSVRRPKMCPFHSELVDWSLQFGDPEKAMNMMGSHMFSDQSCKGGHQGTCNFKPQMATQSYWDQKQQEAEERAVMRQGPTPVTQEIPSLEPIHDETDYEPPSEHYDHLPEIPSTEPWNDGGHNGPESDVSAVGHPEPVTAKWHVLAEAMPHHHHEEPHDLAQSNWVDAAGQPLKEGGDYEMKSPNYEIPDHITIKGMTPDTLHIVIHGEMGMDYGDQITQQDMANEQYMFEPVQELGDAGSVQGGPDTDSAPMDADSANQQDDLSLTTASFEYAQMSPEAQAHFAAITAMENEDPTAVDRSWLMEGDGGMSVDPGTLARVAGKDFTPREQREFIDEDGTARNLDRLDLEGTHYPSENRLETDFLW